MHDPYYTSCISYYFMDTLEGFVHCTTNILVLYTINYIQEHTIILSLSSIIYRLLRVLYHKKFLRKQKVMSTNNFAERQLRKKPSLPWMRNRRGT